MGTGVTVLRSTTQRLVCHARQCCTTLRRYTWRCPYIAATRVRSGETRSQRSRLTPALSRRSRLEVSRWRRSGTPLSFSMSPPQCALLIIDMQRDFLEPGGFGSLLGNDVQLLRRTIAPTLALLQAARARKC